MRDKLRDFFFRPASPLPLAWLRIGIAGTLLLQAFLIAPNITDFVSRTGIIQGQLNDYFVAAAIRGLPQVSWVSRLFSGETDSVRALFLVYLGALVFLVAGCWTRAAAVVTWLAHSMLLNTGYFFNYGANRFAEVALFYLIFMPAGHALSLDRLRGRVSGEPSPWARLSLRVLQIHLAIAYLAAGLAKARGPEWWNGEAMWRSLNLPLFAHFDFSWLAYFPWLLKLFSWGTLVAEIGYAVFIWPRATRKIWVGVVIGLHAGIAFFMGLLTFSMIMITLTLAAFGIPAEPSAPKAIPDFA